VSAHQSGAVRAVLTKVRYRISALDSMAAETAQMRTSWQMS
jgi:hypothetical protein